MTQPTTAERFTTAVELAMQLPDPADIYRAMLSGTSDVDDGIRAATYDSDKTHGGASSSHVERMVAKRNPGQFPRDDEGDRPGTWDSRTDRARDDMLTLRRATDRVLDAISSLNAICCDRGMPDTWAEAVQDAHILAAAGYLQAAMDVGRNVEGEALRFVHAVDTVRAVRDSWMAHAPNQAGLGLVEREGWCRSHQRIDINRPRVSRLLCQQCWRDVLDLEQLGAPVELQTNPDNWPTETMLRAREDGRTVLFQKERQAWLRGHGVDVSLVQEKRRGRRSA